MWNAKNTDRNGIKEQSTHTTHREKVTLERVSWYYLVKPSLFQSNPLSYQPLSFYVKTLDPPLSGKILKTHHQGSSPSRIFSMPGAGLKPAQNLSSCFVERSCAVVITTTPQRHKCGPHRHKRCTLWSPLSFWVPICNRKKAHLHNSEPALKFFLVLAQGKA